MEYPIRVLQVVTQMNRAGLESRLMDIYRAIDRSKIQFDFYTCRTERGDYDDEIESLGGRIYYSSPLSISGIPARFKEFFAEHPEYREVHAHNNQYCGLILKGAKLANVPVRIAHSRTALDKITLKNSVKNIVKLNTNRYATDRFAVSDKAAIWLYGRKAYESGKVSVWPNAIDCKKYVPDPAERENKRKELGLTDEFAVIHVGNFRFEKNHPFLIEIFSKLVEKNPRSVLILAGREDEGKTVRAKAKQLGVADKVMILGSRSDIPQLLQAGDVFVFPSLYEGFPGSVLEAQASGLPAIVSDSVTREVAISDLVEYMSLSESAEVWASKALEKLGLPRTDHTSFFTESGFDIDSLSEKLTEFYLDNYPG